MLAQFFSSLLAFPETRIANSLENPSFNLNSPQAVALLTQGTQSSAGITVTANTAISCAAVWQSVSMISGDVASMTLNCFKRLPSDNRAIDVDHPAQPLVSVEFNEEMDANEGWRRTVAHALLWGNAYLWIEREGETPVALYHLLPDRTSPARLDDGTLYYVTQIDGRAEPLKASEVLHIKGLALEIDKGADLVSQARDAIGLALAAEGFSSKFYAQGCAAGGVLEIPATFNEVAASKLEEGFRKRTEGGNNWFKTVILRDGAKFHQLTIDAQKSQTNELRENQVRDIARFFNLPPGKLGVAGSVSYGSYEHSQLEYLSSCLTHWLRAIAFACGMKFLTREERHKTHYFEHNTSNWIEVDTQTMTTVLTAQIAAKIINANEARRKLNLPKRTDPEAESYGNPNTTPGAAPKPETPETEKPTESTAEPQTTEATPVKKAPSEDVQATALNGAQITSLVAIADKLALGQLPDDGVKALIQAAFPAMSISLIDTIVQSIGNFEPEPLPSGEPSPIPQPEQVQQRRDEVLQAILSEVSKVSQPTQQVQPANQSVVVNIPESKAATIAEIREVVAGLSKGKGDSSTRVELALIRNAFNRDAARLAKRLANHAKNLAKNGKKFDEWLQTNALDQWPLVSEFLGEVVEDAVSLVGGDAGGVVTQIQGTFFGQVSERFSPYLDAPHKASELSVNVEREAANFELEIVPKLAAIVFGGPVNG